MQDPRDVTLQLNVVNPDGSVTKKTCVSLANVEPGETLEKEYGAGGAGSQKIVFRRIVVASGLNPSNADLVLNVYLGKAN